MMRKFGSSLVWVAFDVPLALLSTCIEVHEKMAQVCTLKYLVNDYTRLTIAMLRSYSVRPKPLFLV